MINCSSLTSKEKRRDGVVRQQDQNPPMVYPCGWKGFYPSHGGIDVEFPRPHIKGCDGLMWPYFDYSYTNIPVRE